MSNIILKAKQGRKKEMEQLYLLNKDEAYKLALALTENEELAAHITKHTFKNIWQEFQKSQSIITEEDFMLLAKKRVAEGCKAFLTKANPNAFKLPKDKNFFIKLKPTNYGSIKTVLEPLSDFQRFTFALKVVGELSDNIIAEITKTDIKTLHISFKAIDEYIIKNAVSNETYKCYEDFINTYKNSFEEKNVEDKVTAEVLETILVLSAPTEKKVKTKSIVLLSTITAAIIVVLVMSLLIINAIKTSKTTGDNSFTEGSSSNNSSTESSASNISSNTQETIEYTDEMLETSYYADIDIKDYGKITVALDGKSAPRTVNNFVSLAKSGFYNGLTFHRIMKDFMMQGGDPEGIGFGGSDETVMGEFSANGVNNALTHKRGAISMARSSDYNSASSQFFIVHKDSDFLDGDYAAFGYVTEGMDVVDKVCNNATPTDGNGTISADEQPVINSITIRNP